jgi:hypothetical protein
MAGPYELQSPKDIAMEYGGNKQKIAQAAQMGTIDPTAAVLAGMFIDRMRMAQREEMAPQTTVAQEVMTPQAAQMASPQAAQMASPQMAMAGGSPEAGVAALPVPDEMVPNEFAGGGIVAFANGGDTSPFGRDIRNYMDVAERRREENRLRNLLRQQYGRQAGPFGYFMSQSPEERSKAQDITSRLNTMSAAEMQQLLGMPVTSTAPSQTASEIEKRIAMAESGQGPDVSRPGGINRLPQGLIPEDTPFVSAPPPAAGGPAGGMPKILSAEDQLKRIAELNKAAGVSEDPDAPIKELLERQRGESKEARKEANAMALIAAGLGIAGGDSPYALQNLKGAIPALQQLGVDKRDIRKLDRESDKVEADLARAADARKRGNVDKAIELEDKSFNREMNMRRTIAAEVAANKPSQFREMMAAYQADPEGFTKMMQTKGTGSETAAINRARYALQAIDSQLMTMKSDDPRRKQLEARRDALLSDLAGTGGGAATGNTIQFSDIR